ncbi:MAG: phosphoenolpyruvate--protein phosphotransferase [Blastochloris sp.]|nr:phosphoenolpyruvate--protein phosphotransferase [Blastochloris sp.]
MSKKKLRSDIRLTGIPASPGVVHAKIHVLDREEIHVPALPIEDSEIGAEISRLEEALFQTREQIREIKEHLSQSIGEKDAAIFDAHMLVVEDSSLLEAVRKQVETKKLCVDYVFHHLMLSYAASMRQVDDPYLQERASDIMDVGKRVLKNLRGMAPSEKLHLEEPCILVAHDLTPSDTALFDRKMILGFATDLGNRVSHSAIMARSLNIPSVVGLKDASQSLDSGIPAILDGYEGILILNPSEKTGFEYGQIEQKRHAIEEGLTQLRLTEAISKDGRKVTVSANVELLDDLHLIQSAGAEGIGLYRTEFLFVNRTELPTEEEQITIYQKVMQAAHPHPVIFRTLDVGGDKMFDHLGLSEEQNPFLGWRGIRYSLGSPAIFESQLRAICRAGVGFKVRIMFPMISTYEELVQAKSTLQGVILDLEKEEIAHCSDIEIGAMIEVPSAALIVDRMVPEVDFLSIGTNDLIQYTLAVDRTNEKVAYLYQPTHPAVLQLIQNVVTKAHEGHVWVGVCGEMAGEIMFTPLLLGLGVDELSMGSIFIPRIKRVIQSLNHQEMKALAEEALKMNTGAEVLDLLEKVAHAHYPELLD